MVFPPRFESTKIRKKKETFKFLCVVIRSCHYLLHYLLICLYIYISIKGGKGFLLGLREKSYLHYLSYCLDRLKQSFI